MTYGTVNADVIATSTPQGILGAGNASIMKNRIINGAMVINQRATSVTASAYTVDRFAYYGTQNSKFTVAQSSSAPTGFTNSLLATSSSAYSITASDYFVLYQNIEGYNIADLNWGTANAKTVTLSFQVYSSLTGTFGGCFGNAGTRSYPFTYSIPVANTWTTISVTVPGDTSGTWLTNNVLGLQISWSLGTGSTFSGTAGSWSGGNYVSATGATSVVGTNGATFYITGVQLEVGSSATGFEYRQYQQELSLCQRYYEIFTGNSNGGTLTSAALNSFSNCNLTVFYKQTKRATPTVVYANASGTTPTAYPAIDNCYFSAGGFFYSSTGSGATAMTVSAEL